MSEMIYAGKMPVLALRGLAVFPEQTVHFDVGRVKSALALEEECESCTGAGGSHEGRPNAAADPPEKHCR